MVVPRRRIEDHVRSRVYAGKVVVFGRYPCGDTGVVFATELSPCKVAWLVGPAIVLSDRKYQGRSDTEGEGLRQDGNERKKISTEANKTKTTKRSTKETHVTNEK